jgi:hypothetical protein
VIRVGRVDRGSGRKMVHCELVCPQIPNGSPKSDSDTESDVDPGLLNDIENISDEENNAEGADDGRNLLFPLCRFEILVPSFGVVIRVGRVDRGSGRKMVSGPCRLRMR